MLGAVGARVEVPLQDREGVGLAPGVHVGLEEVEGGLVVGGVEVEGAGQRIARAVRVAELDEQQLGEPEVRRHGGREVAGAARQPGQLLAQRGPLAPLPVPALEEVERPRVSRRGQPGPVEGLARHRGAVGVVGDVQGREPEPDPRGLLPVPLHRGALHQRGGLVSPGPGRRAQPLERLGRPGCAPVEEHGLHRGVEGERVLERLVHEPHAQVGVGHRELGPVAPGVAPAVEQLLRLGVPAERLGARHRPAARLGQVGVDAEGPAVEECGAVPPPDPLLPPPGQRQVALGGLGGTRRAVGLLLEHRGHSGEIARLLPHRGKLPQHLRVAGQAGQRAQEQRLRPPEVRQLTREGRPPAQQRGGARAVPFLARFPLEDGDRLDLLSRGFVDGVARRIRAGRRAHRAWDASYPPTGDPGNYATSGSTLLEAARPGC